ncbi:MAG: hypothetical protein Q7J06_05395, partial [Bacteroidales bacterium]|nr:hypothetical protein [Bacteroidales bacterium]
SSVSGTDNIYLQTAEKKVTALTRSKFGASDLSINGEMVFFSDYTFLGNNICITRLSDAPGRVNENGSSASFLINRFDIKPQPTDTNSVVNYISEPYRKWQHLFKFHSWMPFYADIEEIQSDPASIRPGVSIMTQNHLSTLTSTIGYEYSQEKNHLFHSRITWKGWYPVIESKIDYGDDPRITKFDAPGNHSIIMPGIRFSNTVYIPLHFSSGRFSEYFQPSITSHYQNDYVYIKEEDTYDYNQTILSGRLYFSNYSGSSMRDIYPRWAQTIDLNYSFAPLDKVIYGSAISFKTSLYFPGILANNGIKFRFEKEKQDPVKLLYGNRISFPRGYKDLFSMDYNFLSADYVLPLAYPDFNVASLFYLKRIRTGLFYDYVSGPGNSFFEFSSNGPIPVFSYPDKETFRSFGFELLADFHVLRIPFLISGGVQAAWKKLNESPSFEILFNIDLFGMTLGKRQL